MNWSICSDGGVVYSDTFDPCLPDSTKYSNPLDVVYNPFPSPSIPSGVGEHSTKLE